MPPPFWFSEKRRQRFGARKRTNDQHPRSHATSRLIDEAIAAGARRTKACAALQISERTLRRWRQRMPEGEVHSDRRPDAPRPAPANKLSYEECAEILSFCNSLEFASLPPSQIVPRLADGGRYIASESSFYRVLRAHGQQHHRGRHRAPRRFNPPTSYQATRPCQIWTWGIT